MGRRGPLPTPDPIRQAVGMKDQRKRDKYGRLPTPPVFELVPAAIPPLAWLLGDKEACAEWKRVCPILVQAKLLTYAALEPFAHYCKAHAKLQRLWILPGAGAPPAQLISMYRALANDFALTPAAQHRFAASALQANDDTDDGNGTGNKFAKNGRRGEA